MRGAIKYRASCQPLPTCVFMGDVSSQASLDDAQRGPKLIVVTRKHLDQQRHHRCRGTQAVGVTGMPQYVQNTVLSERTRCPPAAVC